MFKLDRKSILIGASVVASSAILFTGCFGTSAANAGYNPTKNAIDGGVTYPRENGKYTAYYINEQSTAGVNHGRVPTANELKAWDSDIMPDGTGLPDGEGSVELGDEVYEEQCASCHGEFGAGGKGYPTLSGGSIKSLTNQRTAPGMDAPKRTIGTYWPQASTLIWYIRDAMPYAHPKSLSNDEIYGLTAYLLSVNEIKINGETLGDDFVLSKENFLDIKLPNRNGFYPNIDGKDGIENVRAFFADRAKNIGMGTRCMTDCKDPNTLLADKPEAKVMKIGNEITDVVPAYSTVRDLPKEVSANTSPEQALYEANCMVCHKTDTMGAPPVGSHDAWATVVAQGMDKVYANAINGTPNGMPPKGGNMDLTDAQVKSIVDFMVKSSK